MLPCLAQGATAGGDTYLTPGGQPFGVRMESRGVMIVSLSMVDVGGKKCCPAREGGLRVKDVITAVNGQAVANSEAVTGAIAACDGKALTFTVTRGQEQVNLSVRPAKTAQGQYACGMYIRDSASGIGTVTFYMPESGLFGGLGHGVCDSDTGALVPLSHGQVLAVNITGVSRGEAGKPGELRGRFAGRRLGSLVTNSACGVFGLLSTLPDKTHAPLPAAKINEVQEGPATILCTLGEDGVREYAVTISHIDRGGKRPTKSFTVHVTDEALLSRTGGIVQGMSGSPILQNGHIIGAVTHVLVDDPTTGYGIFIENMLAGMKMRAVA